MAVRYRDSGPGARVIAALKQVNWITGTTTTVAIFDSDDDYTQSINLQLGTGEYCNNVGLDFENNAYFIEATLTKSAGALTLCSSS